MGFEMFTKCAAPAKATCKAAIGAVENDVKAIVAALKAIKGPKDLVLKIIDNIFDDSEDIFGELSAASKAFKAAQYMGSGRQLGMAFHRMLVGKSNSTTDMLIVRKADFSHLSICASVLTFFCAIRCARVRN